MVGYGSRSKQNLRGQPTVGYMSLNNIVHAKSRAPTGPFRSKVYTKNHRKPSSENEVAASLINKYGKHAEDDNDDDNSGSDVSLDDIEPSIKEFGRTKGKQINMFQEARDSKARVKTNKHGGIDHDHDSFGEQIKRQRKSGAPIAQPVSHSKQDDDSDLNDLYLSENERALMNAGKPKSYQGKLGAPPSVDGFSSLSTRPGCTPPKRSKEIEDEKKLKKSLTEDESKVEQAGSKFSALLKGLEGNSKNNFAEKLMKNKVKKQEEVAEKSFLEIDLDEEIDAGFRNNFEEIDEQRNFNKQRKIVEEKYKGKTYPGALTQQELEKKAKKHLRCVPKILSGKIASPYYGHASDIAKNSASTILSSSEFMRLPISEFTIGFYGVKRQAIIASMIKNEYEDELNKALLTNKTIQFWSLDSFVFYVLACDVAVRMAASELVISTGEAFDVLFDTVDYGKYITDPVPV